MRLALGRSRVTSPTSLDLAIAGFALVALAVMVASLVQRAIAPIALVPILFAIAAFCGAVLLRRPAPGLAWIATIAGCFAAASVPVDQARAADPSILGVGPWLGFAIPASAGAIATLGIATAYASRPERRLGRAAVGLSLALLGWLVVACATTILLIGSGQARADPAFTWVDVATAPIAAFVPFVLCVAALGTVGDVRRGWNRAREQREPDPPGRSAAERTWAQAVATVRELMPGQSAVRDATAAAERTRLAGDLHATVLPGLRRAIADAEAGGDPETLARRLRTVDTELERLMADRWPVVLEAFGLVAAIEDLAERAEADGGPDVEIDVEQAGERPPPAVERAAWRVAEIAIDNVVRHAAATTIRVIVAVDPGQARLTIEDDGRGFDPSAGGSIRPGARGLADATQRAGAVGATVRIETGSGGGTRVVFDWTSARP